MLEVMSLERFHEAQAGRWAGYDTALAEIRQGQKSSHWIWYVFPQIDGLGRSTTAREYALLNLAEACAYLCDPILRARYEELAGAVLEQLTHGVTIKTLMGGATDALKLASSLTLFHAAAQRLAESDPSFTILADQCAAILSQAAPQGFPACAFTLARITH